MLPLRDLNPTRRVPLVTILIVAVNVAIFVLVQPAAFRALVPTTEQNRVEASFLYEHALVPCELTHGEALTPSLEATCSGTRVGPPGTALFPHKNVVFSVLASMFLHANWLHLLGNLWFLWIFGDNVEDRLGRFRYLAFYLAGGVVAALGQVAASPNSLVPTIGASGAIAAVLGAYLVLFPRTKVVAIILPLFFLPFVVNARLLLAVWFVLQFFTNPASGVAWIAHVTGFVFGALAITLTRRAPRAPDTTRPPR